MRKIEGMTIIMMGASGGMGTATAELLARPGVNLALCSSNPKRMEDLNKKLSESGADIFSSVVDVSSPEQISGFMKEVKKRFGHLDVLINFAGLSITRSLEDFTEDDYNLIMDVNVKGMVFSCKEFASEVEEDGALVINIGSMAAKRANPKAPHYSAAKAAVNMFTEGLSQQLKTKNIRMTVINPGPTDTTFFEGRIPPEKRGDFMKADDIAELIEFLITREKNIIYHDISFDSFAFFKR